MSSPAAILFTAFEPSGDALAAKLIASLKAAEPDRPIYALGGPRMAEAGAILIESTTDRAAMLAGAARQAKAHHARLGRLKAWLGDHPIAATVATDSPAANWGVCKRVRQVRPGAAILHLAAPQLWAWGAWRIRKLRRLTDQVLCLLPFEPAWFRARRVPARFVGHPLFAEAGEGPPPAVVDPDQRFTGPRLALMPGSREAEVQRNWPTQLEAFHRLRAQQPRLRAVVSAADTARAEQIRQLCPEATLPRGMRLTIGQAASVLRWAELALVVSGTASLQCVVHRVPMVVTYRINKPAWHLLGRWLVAARTFTLPNLLSESLGHGRAVPELVPHFGEVEPVMTALQPLLGNTPERRQQREAFEAIHQAYAGVVFTEAAADAVRAHLPDADGDAAQKKKASPIAGTPSK
jgi:lipid-A-disaccharide synthase